VIHIILRFRKRSHASVTHTLLYTTLYIMYTLHIVG